MIENGFLFPTNGGSCAKVINYVHSKNVLIEFQDEYKHRMVTRTTHIRSGAVKNPYQPSVAGVGFVGVGKHIASVGTKSTPEYMLWKRMISRCYDKNFHKRQPTYKDCKVCKEWHNFQNFAEWLSGQKFYQEGCELDKDLVKKGNKIYCPEYCRFVPKQINVILNSCTSSRGLYPVGVTFNKNEKKFTAVLRANGHKKHLGYFKNSDDAFIAYKTAKEAHLKSEAEKIKGRIDNDVYLALMNWRIDTDD
ncbi:MAG: hypothetical protein Q4B81_00050 [Moraxella sp.]|nr:hypothetical protein [Moraxella sp.]